MSLRTPIFHSIRVKLTLSLIAVALFIGLVSLFMGGGLLYQSVIDEANNRVRQDLNVARLIYEERIEALRLALAIIAAEHVGLAPDSIDPARSVARLADRLRLDFWGVADARGKPITGSFQADPSEKTTSAPNPLVEMALNRRQTVAGTLVMNREQLMGANPSPAQRAAIKILSADAGVDASGHKETSGMATGAAVPIVVDGDNLAVIYGGYLLAADTAIVDKIGATVFHNEVYEGRNLGTATIFHNDLRIATSVKDRTGRRALGTRAAPQVAETVLGQGERWTDRARVLDDWTITAYEPISDIDGKRVGMLYVGVLEAKYVDIRRRAILVFGLTTLAGIVIAIVLEWLFAGKLMRPVSNLIEASAQISAGNFSPDIGEISKDDIGRLQRKFLIMAEALKEREERARAESETRLIQSAKQASVGQLAAGVAHEINNPLTAVLTFSHLLLQRDDLPAEAREDLQTVATQTERVRNIVKSLLDFSRQTEITLETVDINALVADTIGLMSNQALIKDVALSFTPQKDLPALTLDRSQFQGVLVNMIINALDATSAGGRITVESAGDDRQEGSGVAIRVTDTGSGIDPDHMDHLFEPFFTTKSVGKGTGLGLAVSAGIIQRHGGSIDVKSKLGSGTTFTIWLPIPDETEPEAEEVS